jgi:hypothetical protein
MKKLLTAIIALAIVLPLKAADFDLYGRVAPGIWFTKRERFYDDSVGVDSVSGKTIIESDSLPLYYNTLWPFGEIGFKLKSDRISVRTEFGVRQSIYSGYVSGVTAPKFFIRELWAVYARHFYLQWFINDWMSLLLGKTEAPACFFSSNQRFYGGNNFRNSGSLYTGSNAMIQLSFGNALSSADFTPVFSWEAKAAAVKVDTAVVNLYEPGAVPITEVKSDTKFPKFEGSFEAQLEKDFLTASLELGGGFQQYQMYYNGKEPQFDKSKMKINSYVVGYNLEVKVGPVRAAYNWAWGQNLGAYGVEISSPYLWRQREVPGLPNIAVPTLVDIFYPRHFQVNDTTWEMKHGKAVQMCGILNVAPFEWLSFEGGYGYVHANHDHPELDSTWEDTHAYYVGAQCKIADILEINPEFGQYLYGHKPGFGRVTYWGVEFAILF